jgi:hypothetical protein
MCELAEEVNAAIKESQKDLHPHEAEVSTPMDDVVPVEVVEEELPVAPEPSSTELVADVAPAPPPIAPPKFKYGWVGRGTVES